MATLLVRSCPFPDCKFEHVAEISTPGDVIDDEIGTHLDEAHPGWTVDEVRRLAAEQLVERRRAAAGALIAQTLDDLMPAFEGDDEVIAGDWKITRV